MTELMRRRRALMAAQGEPPLMAQLTPGTYVGAGHTEQTVGTGGTITSATRVAYMITIPLTMSIPYKAGDVLRLSQDRTYKSMDGFRDISFGGSQTLVVVNNVNMNNYRSKSVTAQSDGYIDCVIFGNCSSVDVGTVKPLIYINDVLVMGG